MLRSYRDSCSNPAVQMFIITGHFSDCSGGVNAQRLTELDCGHVVSCSEDTLPHHQNSENPHHLPTGLLPPVSAFSRVFVSWPK